MQKTLTDINPYASNEQLATFGQMLNSLSNSTYGKTEKVTKVNCDAESGGGKTAPTFTLVQGTTDIENGGTYNFAANANVAFNLTYNGDSDVFVTYSPANGMDSIRRGGTLDFAFGMPAGTFTVSSTFKKPRTIKPPKSLSPLYLLKEG